jgi:AraC family transcriptional regulator of adaptative response / DNA-3-methyladenine glycosylase II
MTGGTDKPARRSVAQQREKLSTEILARITMGAISEKGVRGLADSLHISERQLRRIVQEKTGQSPTSLNKTKRLLAAQSLVIETSLPIIDIAFRTDYASLRQFNNAFKETFKISPSGMRKASLLVVVPQISTKNT